jgi:DNA-binding transcriptional LysR family regulator
MDRLKTIESFVSVARNNSFSKAASDLGISRALVTRHINDLEKHVGARLLNRTTRQTVLTAIGQAYLEMCVLILRDVAESEGAIRQLQREPEGVLRVVAPKSFGGFHFADAVSAFVARHPKIRVTLSLDDSSNHDLNIASSDYDVAIRLSPLAENSTTVVRQIGILEWIVCAAPAYLEANGVPRSVAELAQANCLLHSTLAANRIWRFGTGKDQVDVKVSGNFACNSVLAIRRAALAGIGIAQVPTYYVASDLTAGRLRRIPLDPGPQSKPVYALLPGNRLTPKKAQLFVSFIARWFKTRPWENRVNVF